MNYTETFNDFAARTTPTDLALYAGAALVLWVLFKDKLSPVQVLVKGVVDKVKQLLSSGKTGVVSTPIFVSKKEDVFFDLVSSWKQTRDLAVKGGCDEAVKVADQMFPFLSPNGCNKKQEN
jgi:hypothetical protein